MHHTVTAFQTYPFLWQRLTDTHYPWTIACRAKRTTAFLCCCFCPSGRRCCCAFSRCRPNFTHCCRRLFWLWRTRNSHLSDNRTRDIRCHASKQANHQVNPGVVVAFYYCTCLFDGKSKQQTSGLNSRFYLHFLARERKTKEQALSLITGLCKASRIKKVRQRKIERAQGGR